MWIGGLKFAILVHFQCISKGAKSSLTSNDQTIELYSFHDRPSTIIKSNEYFDDHYIDYMKGNYFALTDNVKTSSSQTPCFKISLYSKKCACHFQCSGITQSLHLRQPSPLHSTQFDHMRFNNYKILSIFFFLSFFFEKQGFIKRSFMGILGAKGVHN